MKTRICENYSRNTTIGENDIYRKFSREFEKMFHAGDTAIDKEDFERLYVQEPEFEKQIEAFRKSDVNLTKFCVGYTGIGKTTGIRHCFGLGVGKETLIDEKKGEIIFPTFLDGIKKDIKCFQLTSRIAAVCSKIEKRYPDLRQYFQTLDGKRELYNFIQEHTGFALEGINPVEAMDMSEETLIIESLKYAYTQNPFEYQANRLKLLIKKKYNVIKGLTIILDDIESLPQLYQGEIIENFLKFKECMLNTDFPKDHDYNVKLLISIRPHTLRLFHNSRTMETFCIDTPEILKRDSVDLSEIFTRRFNYYKEQMGYTVGNTDTWTECYQVLENLNNQFEDKYKNMIKKLCFLNIREALSTYARIFANRLWIQKGKIKEEYFSLNLKEYQFNNINVIRAIASNEECVFWGDRSICIPNIFYTSIEGDLSINCLLVLQYFHRKRNGDVYGLHAATLEEVYNEWGSVLDSISREHMKTALEYLFELHILRKSIRDFDDMRTMDTKYSLHEDSRLYISPRGEELLEMFQRDSVLLELLRETAWREYENRENYSQKCSYELMSQKKQEIIFYDLLEYIDYFREKEDDILSNVTNKYKYRLLFGYTPIVSNLLEGVKCSLDYSGYINYSGMRQYYEDIKRRIEELYTT